MRLVSLALPIVAAIGCIAFMTIAQAQTAASKPGTVFRDCADCPEMVVIPPGHFTMGSPATETNRDKDEEPQHAVTIPGSFAVSKFEVTRGQFGEFVRESGHVVEDNCYVWTGTKRERVQGKGWHDPNFPQDNNHPVVCVAWDDAKAYIAWLARKTGQPYRFLSEAEWEYAARAGSTGRFSFGENDDELCKYGNVADATTKEAGGPADGIYGNCTDGFGMATAPVGFFAANRFGLHDMHGNVWEWLEDCYHDSYSGAPLDGSAWISGECKTRVVRGGAWTPYPRNNRSAGRLWSDPDLYRNVLGFRLARTLELK